MTREQHAWFDRAWRGLLLGLMTLFVVNIGLMIAAVVPCTLATASVSTRQAGGNDAVSLLVTLLTNLICVVLTPLWLKWTISIEAGIDPLPVIANLAGNVLLPTILGQVAREHPPSQYLLARNGVRMGVHELVMQQRGFDGAGLHDRAGWRASVPARPKIDLGDGVGVEQLPLVLAGHRHPGRQLLDQMGSRGREAIANHFVAARMDHRASLPGAALQVRLHSFGVIKKLVHVGHDDPVGAAPALLPDMLPQRL